MGTPGRFGHRGGGGIEADDEDVRRRGGPGQDGAAIAGTEIEDHPLGAGDPVGDLADVHVGGLVADDGAHGPQSTLGS